MAEVAVGVRPHSGWAIVVAVTAAPVRLVHRDRIDLLADGDPAQPWHVAQQEGLTPEEASALATRVEAGAAAAAEQAITAVVDAVRSGGDDPVAVSIVGEPRDVPPADVVLRNHALLHAAEGELFREVLADAASDLGLEVVVVPPKSIDLGPLAATLADLGQAAGAPWRADHKVAVAAALRALGR